MIAAYLAAIIAGAALLIGFSVGFWFGILATGRLFGLHVARVAREGGLSSENIAKLLGFTPEELENTTKYARKVSPPDNKKVARFSSPQYQAEMESFLTKRSVKER